MRIAIAGDVDFFMRQSFNADRGRNPRRLQWPEIFLYQVLLGQKITWSFGPFGPMDSGEEIGSAHLLTQSEAYWALTHHTGKYL